MTECPEVNIVTISLDGMNGSEHRNNLT